MASLLLVIIRGHFKVKKEYNQANERISVQKTLIFYNHFASNLILYENEAGAT